MKKILTFITIMVIGLCCCLTPVAYAEETVEDNTYEEVETPTEEEVPVEDESEGVENEPTTDEPILDEEYITSELGDYFKEEIAPYLIDLGISLIGFIVSCLILWIKNKKSFLTLNSDFTTNMEEFAKKIEEHLAKNEEEVKSILEKQTTSMGSKLFANNISNNMLKDELVKMTTSLKEDKERMQKEIDVLKVENKKLLEDNQKIAVISEDLTKLKNSFRIIAVNDSKLVANGQAKYIAKELETNGEEGI